LIKVSQVDQFYDFHSILYGMIKILVLVVIGYALFRRNILTKAGIESVNNVVYWACLPALIMTKTTSTFSPSEHGQWWFLPAVSVLMSCLGFIMGVLCLRTMPQLKPKKEFVSAMAFQNVGYLPMALTAFICSGTFCNEVLLYIFLFMIGFNITMWSVAPAYLSDNKGISFDWKTVLNPPLVATILAISGVFLLGRGWVPAILDDPLSMLGDTTFPLALITLGGSLAEHRGHVSDNWQATITGTVLKLLIFPAVVFLIVNNIPLDPAYKFFIFLESTMPSAVTLIIVGQYKKADNKFLSGIIFYTHLAGIATIPLCLYLFRFAVK